MLRAERRKVWSVCGAKRSSGRLSGATRATLGEQDNEGTFRYIGTDAPNVAVSISCSEWTCNSLLLCHIPARTREPRPRTHRWTPRPDRPRQCHYRHSSPGASHRRAARERSGPTQGKRRPTSDDPEGQLQAEGPPVRRKNGPTTTGFGAGTRWQRRSVGLSSARTRAASRPGTVTFTARRRFPQGTSGKREQRVRVSWRQPSGEQAWW